MYFYLFIYFIQILMWAGLKDNSAADVESKIVCWLSKQSYDEILTKSNKSSKTYNRTLLNLTVRPDRPDDFSDDPIILQPLSVMTSLTLHPWCRIPSRCPLTLCCVDGRHVSPEQRRFWVETSCKILALSTSLLDDRVKSRLLFELWGSVVALLRVRWKINTTHMFLC